jgi:hypothetical protein
MIHRYGWYLMSYPYLPGISDGVHDVVATETTITQSRISQDFSRPARQRTTFTVAASDAPVFNPITPRYFGGNRC